jgi:hypothetical protein
MILGSDIKSRNKNISKKIYGHFVEQVNHETCHVMRLPQEIAEPSMLYVIHLVSSITMFALINLDTSCLKI